MPAGGSRACLFLICGGELVIDESSSANELGQCSCNIAYSQQNSGGFRVQAGGQQQTRITVFFDTCENVTVTKQHMTATAQLRHCVIDQLVAFFARTSLLEDPKLAAKRGHHQK